MTRNVVTVVLLTIAFLVIIFCGTSAGFAYAERNVFYPGVRIAGVNVGGKSYQDAERFFANRDATLVGQKVVVQLDNIAAGRNTATGGYPVIEVPTTAEQLGLTISAKDALQSAWQVGRQTNIFKWLGSVWGAITAPQNFPVSYQVVSTNVDAFVTTKVVPYVTAPTPAKLSITGGDISIEDQKSGVQIDTAALVTALNGQLPQVLDGDALYVKALVSEQASTITRATLEPLASQVNRLGNLSLSITDIGGGALNPNRTQMLSFFTPVQTQDGTVSIDVDSKKLTSYITSAGPAEADAVKTASDATVQLRAAIAEAAKTSDATPLTARTLQLTRKPAKVVVAGTFTPGLFPGKYIQVNLAEQKLYRVEGDNLVKVYIISSGFWSTPTPKGTFTIASKSPRAYSATFGLYMPYWMNFVGTPDNSTTPLPIGDYGLHELPEWPNGYKEGQAHLGTPVSHGCVRLGVGDAAEVYAWADIGTPVVIH